MDPDACLADILWTVKEHLRGDEGVDYDLLCERIDSLDQWIVKGGYLPERWKTINCCTEHKGQKND